MTGDAATRWIDMTAADIAELAHAQIAGNFGPASDALTALHLIEALAHRLGNSEARNASGEAAAPPPDVSEKGPGRT